jgi:hypothetical protein
MIAASPPVDRCQAATGPIGLADNQVAGATMLGLANNEYGLADEWVKGVSDSDFARQTPSIMDSPPRTRAQTIAPRANHGA